MRLKILGLVALAALVATLGTIGLSERQSAQANPLPIPTVTGTASPWTVSGIFDEDDACPTWPAVSGCQATVTITPVISTANPTLTFSSCTIDTNANGSVADETTGNCAAVVSDADPAANVFTVSTANTAALDANTVNNIWRLNLTITASCLTTTVFTVVYTQDDGSAQTQFTCTGSAAATLAIGKIDQNGTNRPAVFGVGSPGFATAPSWTLVTSATVNPCWSGSPGSTPCTTNPNTSAGSGQFPPAVGGGFTIEANRWIEVREISQPATCTLVEIKLGGRTSTTILPLSFPVNAMFDGAVWTVNSNGVPFGQVPGSRLDLTYVNSCAIPGGANSAGSSLAIVIGGSTLGLTNSTHVEIIPAPGSDDDARIDVRIRDTNNIPLVGAHVTVMTDRGYLSMRFDTTGTTVSIPGGYDVIEPSNPNFGTPFSGDTCDQITFQAANASGNTTYNGGVTRAYYTGSPMIQDGYTNNDGIISACLYVGPDVVSGITPGRATITVIVENTQVSTCCVNGPYAPQNLVLTGTLTVVGPPASVRVAASPTSLQCGEKATITATVTDSIGQNVSDHTRIELVSNYGSTIGGTGATLGFPGTGPVNPISSSAAETFSGVATAFLLTSTEHVGPYEVVVATGGSVGGIWNPYLETRGQSGAAPGNYVYDPITGLGSFAFRANQPGVTYSTGAFSTAPVSAQVTVTCALPIVAIPSIPIPPIAAPRTGEGIRPPNTGDAGLADTSGGSMTLVLAGAAAFVLAGVASVKFARR